MRYKCDMLYQIYRASGGMLVYKSKVLKVLSSLNELKWSVASKGILSGLIAGLLVVIYRIGIEYGNDTATKIFAYLRLHPLFIFLWLIVAIAIGLFISWLVKLLETSLQNRS